MTSTTTINGLPAAAAAALTDELEVDAYPHTVNSSVKVTLAQQKACPGPVYGVVRAVTATSSTAVTDRTLRCDATAGAIVLTLVGATGQFLTLLKVDATGSGVTTTGATVNGTAVNLTTQWAKVTLQYNGATWDQV